MNKKERKKGRKEERKKERKKGFKMTSPVIYDNIYPPDFLDKNEEMKDTNIN